mmetsp:Transcript_14486/g.36025  ORF Transcript_14486/g.36025 Transcript_14486/m.36025 type:complete len:284 (+) Transcript_14486:1163-2014(+)
MATLMVRGEPPVLVRDDRALALSAHDDAVARVLQAAHGDRLVAQARSVQRGHVDQVGQVGAGEAGGGARDGREFDIRCAWDGLEMALQDLLPALHIRVRHHHVAVEAAGAHQRLVQHLGEVGGGHHDDALARLEPVQLHQHLVQRHAHVLLVLGVAVASDGVDLVDEDDAGRVLLGGREQVAHAARAHTHKHLLELGARRVEKGDARLARDRARQHGLASAGRPHQQHALGQLGAQPCELSWVLEELHHLLELLLGLVAPAHVLERPNVLLRHLIPLVLLGVH